MLRVNKYIFVEVCDKDFDKYNDIITTIKEDFFKIINEISCVKTSHEIRIMAHKLVGIVSIFKGSNSEIIYILKSLLDIPKSCNDFVLYKFYVDALINTNFDNMF